MDASERKKLNVITKYVLECFSETDWYTLGQLVGSLETVQSHGRLLRSLSFGDGDYPYCVAEVLNTIFDKSPAAIDEVIDHFDIDVWYEQKDPRKYHKIFSASPVHSPDFWVGVSKPFTASSSANKVARVRTLAGWEVLSDEELKILLERISLSEHERKELNDMVLRVGAFREKMQKSLETDIPF